jgi:dynein heavy chain
LHPNALITAQFDQARRFIDTVTSVQPRLTGGGTGKKPEEIVASIAEGFLEKLPEAMKAKQAHPDTYMKTKAGGIVSIGVFHSQEYTRFTKMLGVMKSTLKNLGKAIKGLVLMSADMEGMYNSFLVQHVPANWAKVAYPCLKPLNSWVDDFIKRLEFMSGWLLNGPPPSFWLSCFFFPQGFMTASLQLHARMTQIPIDTLEFFSNVIKTEDPATITASPETGVHIHGLFLQGCGWDSQAGQLRESEPDVLFMPLPVIWLEPMGSAEVPKIVLERNLYPCPLYKTSERKGTLSTTGHSTNWVKNYPLRQPLPEPSHWISRGVALLCMLDD